LASGLLCAITKLLPNFRENLLDTVNDLLFDTLLLSFFAGARGEDDNGNLVGGAFAKAIVDDIL
jgi:hypothetical protein